MSKILEKSLKDAVKEDRLIFGARQVANSSNNSSLIVLSRSVEKGISEKVESAAKDKDIPLVKFPGTSVALGRLCGLQFRISTLSFTSIPNSSVQSIIKDMETEQR